MVALTSKAAVIIYLIMIKLAIGWFIDSKLTGKSGFEGLSDFFVLLIGIPVMIFLGFILFKVCFLTLPSPPFEYLIQSIKNLLFACLVIPITIWITLVLSGFIRILFGN